MRKLAAGIIILGFLALSGCVAPTLNFGDSTLLPLSLQVPGDSLGSVTRAIPEGSRAIPPGASRLEVQATGGPLGAEVRVFRFAVAAGMNTFEIPGLPYGTIRLTLDLYDPAGTRLTTSSFTVDFQPGMPVVGATMAPAGTPGPGPVNLADGQTQFYAVNVDESSRYRVLTLTQPGAQWLDGFQADGSPYPEIYARGRDFLILTPKAIGPLVVGVKAEAGQTLPGLTFQVMDGIFIDQDTGDDKNSGLAPNQALSSYAGAKNLVKPGDAVLFAGSKTPYGTTDPYDGFQITSPQQWIGGFRDNFKFHSPTQSPTGFTFSGTSGAAVISSNVGTGAVTLRDLEIGSGSQPSNVAVGVDFRAGASGALFNVRVHPAQRNGATLRGVQTQGYLFVKNSTIQGGTLTGTGSLTVEGLWSAGTGSLEVHDSRISGGTAVPMDNATQVHLFGIRMSTAGKTLLVNRSRVWAGVNAPGFQTTPYGFLYSFNEAVGIRVGNRTNTLGGNGYPAVITSSVVGGGLYFADSKFQTTVEYQALNLFEQPRALIVGNTLDGGYATNFGSSGGFFQYPVMLGNPNQVRLENNILVNSQYSYGIFTPADVNTPQFPKSLKANSFDSRGFSQYSYEDRFSTPVKITNYFIEPQAGQEKLATVSSGLDNFLSDLSGLVQKYSLDSKSFHGNYDGTVGVFASGIKTGYSETDAKEVVNSIVDQLLGFNGDLKDKTLFTYLSYDLNRKLRSLWSAGALE